MQKFCRNKQKESAFDSGLVKAIVLKMVVVGTTLRMMVAMRQRFCSMFSLTIT